MLQVAGVIYGFLKAPSGLNDLAPCHMSCGGKTFKLRIIIDSASLAVNDTPNQLKGLHSFISVSTGGGKKTKVTEYGVYRLSEQDDCVVFDETITMEVLPRDEICISLHCSVQYDFGMTALMLSSTMVGETAIPVMTILPAMRKESRLIEGMISTTARLGYDLLKEGRKRGRVYATFEATEQLPEDETITVERQPPCCNSPEHNDGAVDRPMAPARPRAYEKPSSRSSKLSL